MNLTRSAPQTDCRGPCRLSACVVDRLELEASALKMGHKYEIPLRYEALVCSVLLVAVSGCGGNSSPASASGAAPSATVRLVGEVSDPPGDALRFTGGQNPPDLLMASIRVMTNDQVVVSVTFAPGTTKRETFVQIFLDVDEDASTGQPGTYWGTANQVGVDDLGVDVVIELEDKSTCHTVYYDGRTRRQGPENTPNFQGDQFNCEFPLSRLGPREDGRLKFRVQAGDFAGGSYLGDSDVAPEPTTPPGLVR